MCDEFQMPSVVSMIPGLLLDKERTLLTLRQSWSTAWKKPLITLFEQQTLQCEQMYQHYLEQKRILQEEITQLSVQAEHVKKEVYEKELERKIVRDKIMTQTQNLSSALKQVPDERGLTELMEKVHSLKDGIGKKKSDLKKELESYKKGILFYKKYLRCTVMFISKDTIIVTFDTSAKSVLEAREYLKFSVHDDGITFQFLEMRPKLKTEQQLLKKYNETGDIQGFIVSFWNITKAMNSRKVLGEKN